MRGLPLKLASSCIFGAFAGLWFGGPENHWSDFWVMGCLAWVSVASAFGQVLLLIDPKSANFVRECLLIAWGAGMVAAAWCVSN